MEKKIMVEIFGDQYPLITDGDEAHVRELAAMVDDRMRAIARKSQGLSGIRVGVMAALQLADEYSQKKKDYDDLVAMLGPRR